jgi:CubicO group peptidase (beta-lactamase class C family)
MGPSEEGVTRRSFLGAGATAMLSRAAPGRTLRAQASGGTVAPPASLLGVRNYVMEKIDAGIVPSLVVQVTRRGRPIWAEAFGFADLERRRPATVDSIYKIASISKPFTVSGLMTLVDRGQVDFDASANTYLLGARLRAYRGSPDAMTLRRLANHTSGLPTHEILFYDGAERLPPTETVSRYGFAAWTPGSRFHYSNLGTAILGFISADLTGKSWPVFMRDSLFEPLGLRNTFAELIPGREREQAGAAAERLTRQYDYDVSGRFVPTGAHLTSHPGASSMWSNAADLTAFAEMHLGGGERRGRRILSPRAVAMMQDFTVRTPETGVTYGNGWITHAGLVRPNFNHSGGPGMGVMLAAYPQDDTITVVLTNYFGAMATETTRRIAEALFGTASPAAPPQSGQASMPASGRWRGVLRHHAGDIPIDLSITGGESAELRFGRMPVPLSQVSARNGFQGTAVGILMRGPGYHGDSIIDFILRVEEGRLIGIADTYAKGYFEVAHWVELNPVI